MGDKDSLKMDFMRAISAILSIFNAPFLGTFYI
jgi:hypothetical protein